VERERQKDGWLDIMEGDKGDGERHDNKSEVDSRSITSFMWIARNNSITWISLLLCCGCFQQGNQAEVMSCDTKKDSS